MPGTGRRSSVRSWAVGPALNRAAVTTESSAAPDGARPAGLQTTLHLIHPRETSGARERPVTRRTDRFEVVNSGAGSMSDTRYSATSGRRASRPTRRQFGRAVASTAVGAIAAPAIVRGRNLNEKLNIALIGVGG